MTLLDGNCENQDGVHICGPATDNIHIPHASGRCGDDALVANATDGAEQHIGGGGDVEMSVSSAKFTNTRTCGLVRTAASDTGPYEATLTLGTAVFDPNGYSPSIKLGGGDTASADLTTCVIGDVTIRSETSLDTIINCVQGVDLLRIGHIEIEAPGTTTLLDTINSFVNRVDITALFRGDGAAG